ncbi:hypothetical protein [Pseudobacter ginsenosidimutans]|uniref:hypothetical protein n=1 Tax=Pseudobacter ginsenosidimutans TaxID=661488 RepID=UPI00102E078F|nr:hypothetical protein [Pseudobacter ginsenosidimutans]QEC44790.1 hypothetical protein FSB84_25055 [Pseudobacter ginsenosidimutans]
MLLIKRAAAIVPALLSIMYASAQQSDSSQIRRKLDSLGSAMKSKGNSAISDAKKEVVSLSGIPGSTLKSGWNDIKYGVSAQLLPKTQLFQKGMSFKSQLPSLKTGYAYLKDASGSDTGVYAGLNHVFNYDVQAGVSFMQLPFNFAFSGYNDVYSFNNPSPEQLIKFNFDHKAYLEKIRKQVADKVNPDAVLAATTERIKAIRERYEQQLKQELQEMQQSYQKQYKLALEIPNGVTDLNTSDLQKLKSTMFAQADKTAYEQSVLRLQQHALKGEAGSDSSTIGDEAEVNKMETLKKMYEKVIQYKEKFTNNKIVKQLQSHLPFTPDKFKDYLKDPANLDKVVGEHAELSSLQRIFMSITKLDIGQNAVESGDFGMQQFVNSGINTEFKNKKASFGFIYGKNNTPNNFLQGGLMNGVSNEYSTVTGFKLGTGSGSPIDQSVSVNFYDYKNSYGQDLEDVAMRPAWNPSFARRDAVITLHTGLKTGSNQWNLDLSKSFGATGQGNGINESQKSDAYSKVFSNQGNSNYAGLISFDGEVLNSDLRVFVKKVGLGYNNPGNYLLRRGETQVGIGFGKKVLRNRINLKYATDFKQQVFDPAKRYVHQAFSNKLQVGYKIKGNNRVGLLYQRSDFNSKLFGDGSATGANSRWQADGAYTLRLGSRKLMNNLLVSRQHFDMPMLEDSSYKSNNTLVSYTATTLLKQSPLSLTLLLNKSDNKDYLFNTSMFSVESNYSYNVSSLVRLGSGIGYYSNTGWNRQLGCRQQISGTLMNRLDIDLELSYKKAVKVIREEMADQLFITAGMRMNF